MKKQKNIAKSKNKKETMNQRKVTVKLHEVSEKLVKNEQLSAKKTIPKIMKVSEVGYLSI